MPLEAAIADLNDLKRKRREVSIINIYYFSLFLRFATETDLLTGPHPTSTDLNF